MNPHGFKCSRTPEPGAMAWNKVRFPKSCLGTNVPVVLTDGLRIGCGRGQVRRQPQKRSHSQIGHRWMRAGFAFSSEVEEGSE
jgi:hypothetical protein